MSIFQIFNIDERITSRVRYLGTIVCKFVACVHAFKLGNSLDLDEYVNEYSRSNYFQSADVKVVVSTCSNRNIFSLLVGAMFLDCHSHMFDTVSQFVTDYLLSDESPHMIATVDLLKEVNQSKKRLEARMKGNQQNIDTLTSKIKLLQQEQATILAQSKRLQEASEKVLQRYPHRCPSSLYNELKRNGTEELIKEFSHHD